MPPGGIHDWALTILTALPNFERQQQLRGLTVTATPLPHSSVQCLGVTGVNVVSMPSGEIAVNFLVTNNHATSTCGGYKWWVAMVVP